MVAKNTWLPNIRRLFAPDPGYTLVEADLSGADAQVVAWEAEDEDLKTAFRAGMKLHAKNARDVYPEKVGSMTDADLKKLDYPGGLYHDLKRIVHATNYVGSARTIANIIKWPVFEVEDFQDRWFSLHPGIGRWHKRTDNHLHGIPHCPCWTCKRDRRNAHPQRTIYNRFGYRIVYFDRVESLLSEAVAWTPQSTVANVRTKGTHQLEDRFPFIEVLLEVHDSIVFQFPTEYESLVDEMHRTLHVPVPYDDELIIPWGWAMTRENWGAIS